MGATELRYLGHASILLRSEQVSVVTDPWFSPSGAFLGAWHPFPANDHLDLDEIRSVDYVVLSHEHQDHFDIEFLRTIAPTTTIVVPKYHDAWLVHALTALPNNVIVVDDRTSMALGDIHFTPVIQSAPIWDDATLIFETPFGTVIDANDMKLNANDIAWLRSNHPNPEWLFLQFSGANWHPVAYDYPAEEKAQISRAKVAAKFRNVTNHIEALQPRYAVPCAGPAAFLDHDQFDLNFAESIFPRQDVFQAHAELHGIGDRVVVALPGDVLVGGTADPIALTKRNVVSDPFTNTKDYLSAYRDRRRSAIVTSLDAVPEQTESLLTAAHGYFGALMAAGPQFCEWINGRVLLDLTGQRPERLVVDFTTPDDAVRLDDGDDCFYRLRFEGRWLREIIEGRLTWEQLLLSLRFEAHRSVDVYNEDLIVFLRFADPSAYAAYAAWRAERRTGDFFEVELADRTVKVQRLCPHAGGDLSKGTVDGDAIVCPVHNWRFSLVDGTCAKSPRHRLQLQ